VSRGFGIAVVAGKASMRFHRVSPTSIGEENEHLADTGGGCEREPASIVIERIKGEREPKAAGARQVFARGKLVPWILLGWREYFVVSTTKLSYE
jgi:hypothetical protein